MKNTKETLETKIGYFKTFRLLIRMLWRISPQLFLGLLFLALLSGLTMPVLQLLTATLIDLIVRSLSAKSTVPGQSNELIALLVGMGITMVVNQVTTGLRSSAERLYQKKVTQSISLLIAGKAASLDLAFFENPEFHNKLTNANIDAASRPVAILTSLMSAVSTSTALISTTTILLLWQWWIVLLLLFTSLLRFRVLTWFGKERVRLRIEKTPKVRKSQYISTLLTSDYYVKEIRVFGLSAFFLTSYRKLLESIYADDKSIARSEMITSLILEGNLSCIRPIMIAFTAFQAFQHNISIGQLTLYIQTIVQVETNLSNFMSTLAQFHEHNMFIENLFRFLELQPDVETPRASKLSNKALLKSPLIEFRNVSFRYPDKGTSVLENISFQIKPGEAIALVGENGAGKTTLIKLLTGLYHPTGGKILFDGVDITTLDRSDLRAFLGVIFQDFSIYHFPVYDNVAFGQVDYIDDRDRVEKAAWRSGLATLVEQFPHGYETVLGRLIDRGQELSGGQRQLVALARALMRDAPVLVLDEPGAALDAQKEEMFFERLLNKHRKKMQSVIFISHRFSTVRRADRIIVLENKHVIEQGTHNELMARNGRYAEMFALHARGYVGSAKPEIMPAAPTTDEKPEIVTIASTSDKEDSTVRYSPSLFKGLEKLRKDA